MSEYVLSGAREESIVLSGGAAEKLLRGGNGDAALLYIAFLRDRGASDAGALCARLGWTRERFDLAARALEGMELLRRPEGAPPVKMPEKAPVEPARERPEYTNADLLGALERSEFASLSAAVDQALGKKLTTPDQKILLGLYDDLGLGADVIFLLVNFCLERSAARYGAGRRPTMRQIEQEGYAWARKELFSTAAANAYLQREREKRSNFGEYMAALGFGTRKPAPSEEKYLARWAEMGFDAATLAVAYDKTVLRCGEFKWSYCNGILKKWHENGIHTAQEAAQEGKRGKKSEPQQSDRNAWMEKYL